MRLIPKKDNQPQYINSKVNTLLINYKTYHFTKVEIISYTLLFFVVGGIVGLIFYMNLFMSEGEATITTHISNLIVFLLFGCISLRIFLPMRKTALYEKRNTKFTLQFREMLSSLSTSLSSGDNVYGAFNNAYAEICSQFGEGSMMAQELYVLVHGMDNGYTIVELLKDFSERSVSEDIINFVNVFETCYRTGGDMKAVIRNTYDLIGDKIAITEEIKTKLTSNKMQQNVMSIMPIVIIAFLRFSSSQFSENFSSPSGVVMMTVAVAIFVGSYLYGRKIIDVKG
ncbi:MAG: type II secretion system F family protein [Ruminococcus sp.]